jgi:predicted MFS family arabinose efflux permease
MIGRFSRFYIDAFRGLSREMWLLSFATLVNRAGTMVIPFLAIYMTKELNFSLTQVGWVMSFFGLGSLIGSWLGGKLTDYFSFHKIMVITLFLSGVGFIFLFQFKSFASVCLAILILMSVADAFRPAAFTAIDSYSKPENRVRSISLLRLFINLGYSIGPAFGGFLMYKYGSKWLFYIDGLTCMFASILILILLKQKDPSKEEKAGLRLERNNSKSVWKDRPYLLLLLIIFLIDVAFFQMFANLPLYYKDVHHLNEKTIGWIMALNGIVIFVTEMPIVSWLEIKKADHIRIVFWASVMIGMGFLILNTGMWFPILIVSMILLTIGEMLGFPFSNSWSLTRAPKGRVGEYMGLYTVAFALSHIIGPNLGMRISDQYGFEASWYVMGIFGLVGAALAMVLIKILKKEKLSLADSLV